jgi:hypothetical protein
MVTPARSSFGRLNSVTRRPWRVAVEEQLVVRLYVVEREWQWASISPA